MAWSNKIITGLWVSVLFSAFSTGCAAVDRKVSLLYQPVVQGSGGSGEIYLSAMAGQSGLAGKNAMQWIVGRVKKKDGEKTGDIVLTTAPEDLVLDAFKQELNAAGYKVVPVDALPQEVAKGLAVAGITVELEEVPDMFKAEGISRLAISIELWKNGRMFRKLDYKSMLSDFAIKNRDQLLPTLLQKSLQEVMKQAIPEIVRALES
jgi:hypothetical protein